MTQWMEYVNWAFGLLGIGGGGLLFYKSRKKNEEAMSRENEVKADIAEANAYCLRIKNLSEEVEQLSEETKRVRSELSETREELQRTKEELTLANNLIRSLKMNKSELEAMLANVNQENAELKRSNSILRMQIGKLRKSNDKSESK